MDFLQSESSKIVSGAAEIQSLADGAFNSRLTLAGPNDPVFTHLQSIFAGTEDPNIKVSALSVKKKTLLMFYPIELPETPRNLRLVKTKISSQLEAINSNDKIKCFIIWTDPKWRTRINGRIAKDFRTRLEQPDLSPNLITSDRKYTDLTNLLFISSDSSKVRRNNVPIYADIEDAFNIQEHEKGYSIKIAFSDITALSQLNFEDPILRNSLRVGHTLYSRRRCMPMVGQKAEALSSLLEGYDRFAWIVDFELSDSGRIDSFKVYLGKIRNRMQMDNDTSEEQMYSAEIVDAFSNVKNAARIIKIKNPIKAAELFKIKAKTQNIDAVSTLMGVAYGLLGEFIAANNYPAIYRVQYLSTSSKDLGYLKNVLKGFDINTDDQTLANPQALAELLVRLLSSKKSKSVQAGITVYDYLTGKTCYSYNPSSHDNVGYNPYIEFKGLRLLSGFVNQHVLNAIIMGIPAKEIKPLVVNLCKIANKRHYERKEIYSYWAYLNWVKGKARNRHFRKTNKKS